MHTSINGRVYDIIAKNETNSVADVTARSAACLFASSAFLPLANSVCLLTFFDKWPWLDDLLSEDIALDKIRKPYGRFVGDKFARWEREDLCKRRRQREARVVERGFNTYGLFLLG